MIDSGVGLGMTRRTLVARGVTGLAGLSGLGALLAGCGGSSSSAATTQKLGGSLNMLSWQGYNLPGIVNAWSKRTGITIHETDINTADDVQAKLALERRTPLYDVVEWDNATCQILRELGLTQPLDLDRIPNAKDLKALLGYFAKDPSNIWRTNGVQNAMPFTWGGIGITYNSAKMSAPRSWYDLLDPSLKGKVGSVNSAFDQLALACRLTGLNTNAIPKADIDKPANMCLRFLRQTHGLSASWGDMTTKLVAGEIVACHLGWAAMNVFAEQKGVKTVKTAFAKEGGYGFCDAWAIPVGAPHVANAYSWINETLDPVIHAKAANTLVGGVTVSASIPHLSPNIRALYPYENIDGFLATSPFYIDPPQKSNTYVTIDEWNNKWQEILQQV